MPMMAGVGAGHAMLQPRAGPTPFRHAHRRAAVEHVDPIAVAVPVGAFGAGGVRDWRHNGFAMVLIGVV